jgi:hypothetical protein
VCRRWSGLHCNNVFSLFLFKFFSSHYLSGALPLLSNLTFYPFYPCT